MASIINAATSGGLITTADTSGILNLQTAGTTAITINASQNVGIGVTPNSWDSLYKAIQVGARSMFFGIGSEANMANNAYYNSGYKYVANSAAGLYTIDANVHKWYNAPSGTAGNAITFTQAMTLDASGNLVVGNTTAWSRLHVTKTVNNTNTAATNITDYQGAAFILHNQDDAGTGNKAGMFFAFAGSPGLLAGMDGYKVSGTWDTGLRWYTNNQTGGNTGTLYERMRIDPSGRLLVGTTSNFGGAGQFAIDQGGGGTPIIHLIGTQGVGGGQRSVGLIFSGVTNDTGPAYGNLARISAAKENATQGNTAGYLEFSTIANGGGLQSQMRIHSSGRVSIGNSTATYPFYISLNGDTGDWFSRFNNTNASSPLGIYVQYSNALPNGTGNQFLYCGDTTTLRAEIRSNGGLANYSGNNTNLSDRREKTNFAPAKSYLDVICAIPVQTFNYIDQSEDDPGLTLGVVAQDVQAVAPELVMESNWVGKDEEPKMRLSIYQTDLQYALMKSIQEQQALITTLTARITALEGGNP